jgi:5-methyltetrahydropteroyltriglutamate--homocysteine methyltransferase
MTDGYRADHVGSLLRPPELLEARANHAAGRISDEQLKSVEDNAVLKALELQGQTGVSIFSDGEYRRSGWGGDFAAAVDGYVPGIRKVNLEWHGPEGAQRPGQAQLANSRVIGEKLRQKRRLTEYESGFLKQHAPGPIKVTMPAASYIGARGYFPGESEKAYPTRVEALNDIVKIIRSEIEALIAEGVAYIQLDNPHYPDYVDAGMREQWHALGVDLDQMLREDIAADAACLDGLERDGVTIAMHLCRGNSRSGWHTSGGYDAISEQVFGGIPVDRWLLEYESERSGGFGPLKAMPKGRTVVLGLISSKDPTLESYDDLLRRVDEAAGYVPTENLALSPQCGFASVVEGNLLSWDEQRRKLELVADTARKIWG